MVPETPARGAPEPSRTVNEPSVNQFSALLPAAPSARGTRLDAGWTPNASDAGFAADLGLNPEAVAAEFRDYWLAVPGTKGRKLDWSATFRNSCRMQAKRRPTQPAKGQPWWMEDMIRERH